MLDDLYNESDRRYQNWDGFQLRKEDIKVPTEILYKINAGKFGRIGDEREKALKEIVNSIISAPILTFLVTSAIYFVIIKGFFLFKTADFFWEATLTSSILVTILIVAFLIHNFPKVTEAVIKREIDKYINSEWHRLYEEYKLTPKYKELCDRENQRKERNENLLMTFNSYMKVFNFFKDYWSFICQYRWIALNEHEIFFRIENIFMNYNIKAIWDPKMTQLSDEGKILYTYFFHKKHSALSAPEVREILSLTETTELGQIVIVNMYKEPAKTAEKVLATTNIITLNLSDFLSNVFFILHFDHFLTGFAGYDGSPIISVVNDIKRKMVKWSQQLLADVSDKIDEDYMKSSISKLDNYSSNIDNLISKFYQSVNDETFSPSCRITSLIPKKKFCFRPINRSEQYFTRNKKTKTFDFDIYDEFEDDDNSFRFRRKKY